VAGEVTTAIVERAPVTAAVPELHNPSVSAPLILPVEPVRTADIPDAVKVPLTITLRALKSAPIKGVLVVDVSMYSFDPPVSPVGPEFGPMQIAAFPVTIFEQANAPSAVLLLPVVLDCIDSSPKVVLNCPVVFAPKALKPKAALAMPVELESKAEFPKALLKSPVVLEKYAPFPTALLDPPALPTLMAAQVAQGPPDPPDTQVQSRVCGLQ